MKKNLNLKVYSFDTKTNCKLKSLCENFNTSEDSILKILIDMAFNDIVIKSKSKYVNITNW